MTTQAPIKRQKAIVSFSKEHHFGLLLVWKIRQGLKKGIAAERIGKYVAYMFKEDIEKHFREEEQWLFSKLPAYDPLRFRAETEHTSIRNLVSAIVEYEHDADLLSRLANELEQHIRFEERKLFNHLQSNIPEEDLDKIAERIPNESKSIDDQWEDAFWNIAA